MSPLLLSSVWALKLLTRFSRNHILKVGGHRNLKTTALILFKLRTHFLHIKSLAPFSFSNFMDFQVHFEIGQSGMCMAHCIVMLVIQSKLEILVAFKVRMGSMSE